MPVESQAYEQDSVEGGEREKYYAKCGIQNINDAAGVLSQ